MIELNEKFALLALPRANLINSVKDLVLSNGLQVTRTLPLKIGGNWERWIGEIRVKQLQEAGCYLLVTGPTSSPEILDGDNQELMRRINGFLNALLIVKTPCLAAKPILLTGANVLGEIRVRQMIDLHTPICQAYNQSAIERVLNQKDLESAAIMADALLRINAEPQATRLKRAIVAFLAGIHEPRPDERLHQFCRCIDGIVLSGKGSGKKDFKSRTALFIGSGHETVAEEIYEMRSAVEHLRPAETEAIDCSDLKAQRTRVLVRAVQTEIIARRCLNRILLCADLLRRFENDEQIRQFWKLPENERKQAWKALNFDEDLAQAVDPRLINNDDLGLHASNENGGCA